MQAVDLQVLNHGQCMCAHPAVLFLIAQVWLSFVTHTHVHAYPS